uniref:Uncharacterized protein n=1 Tax=Arundo donax TaxID=35708 RepID=A0A0A8YQ90_ARUDO
MAFRASTTIDLAENLSNNMTFVKVLSFPSTVKEVSSEFDCCLVYPSVL